MCQLISKTTPQRNTINFERLMGRSQDHPLLAVEQVVSLGEGAGRRTVAATYDVLHDESEIAHVTRDCGSSGTSDDELEGKGGDRNDSEQRGLILLHIVTDKGQLKLKQ
jgi:hypothetical protein